MHSDTQQLNFNLPNVDGSTVELSSYSDQKGVILVFTCNHCPYAIAYEQRIIGLQNKYGNSGYPVVAICSNDAVKYPADSFDRMKEHAEQRGFNFPYLRDESQDVAHAYHAERTPHVFLVVPQNGSFEVVYEGAIDDNWEFENEVKERYLENALEAFEAGQPVSLAKTPPVGCSMKWK